MGGVKATRILTEMSDPSAETVFDQLYDAAGRPGIQTIVAWLLVMVAVLALTEAFMAAGHLRLTSGLT